MVVCVCNGISDKKIDELVKRGAETAAQITKACGAGNDCGMCLMKLEKFIDQRSPKPEERRAQSQNNN